MKLLLSFAFSLSAAIAGITGAAASATTTMTLDVPIAMTTPNPCNGELVAWDGTAHFLAHATSDTHAVIVDEVNFQNVQGVGSLGNTYRIVNSSIFEMSGSGQNTQNEFTVAGTFQFVSQGPALDFKSHVTVHTTIDAAGQPTATVFVDNTSCQGT